VCSGAGTVSRPNRTGVGLASQKLRLPANETRDEKHRREKSMVTLGWKFRRIFGFQGKEWASRGRSFSELAA